MSGWPEAEEGTGRIVYPELEHYWPEVGEGGQSHNVKVVEARRECVRDAEDGAG